MRSTILAPRSNVSYSDQGSHIILSRNSNELNSQEDLITYRCDHCFEGLRTPRENWILVFDLENYAADQVRPSEPSFVPQALDFVLSFTMTTPLFLCQYASLRVD